MLRMFLFRLIMQLWAVWQKERCDKIHHRTVFHEFFFMFSSSGDWRMMTCIAQAQRRLQHIFHAPLDAIFISIAKQANWICVLSAFGNRFQAAQITDTNNRWWRPQFSDARKMQVVYLFGWRLRFDLWFQSLVFRLGFPWIQFCREDRATWKVSYYTSTHIYYYVLEQYSVEWATW